MLSEYTKSQFQKAAEYLPLRLFNAVSFLDDEDKSAAEEFRLRAGRPFFVALPSHEKIVKTYEGKDIIVTSSDIQSLIERATESSVHSFSDTIKAGFITVRGGHRIGVAGTGVTKNGELSIIKNFSSVNLRIAKEIKGVSDGIIEKLVSGGFKSTLIISPPGVGKTTLIRDIIRQISNGIPGLNFLGLRVSIADERCEIAAQNGGIPQFDVGEKTDVLDCCLKSEAVMVLLRAMSPQVIAIDEITAKKDVEALIHCTNCGVKLIATAHADGISDLLARPIYKELLSLNIFENLVEIKQAALKRRYEVTPLRGDEDVKGNRNNTYDRGIGCFRACGIREA